MWRSSRSSGSSRFAESEDERPQRGAEERPEEDGHEGEGGDDGCAGLGLRQAGREEELAEPLGDFLARVRGGQKQASYPSTVAYVAQLVIHRYAMLGILNEDGTPVSSMGVVTASGIACRIAERLASGSDATVEGPEYTTTPSVGLIAKTSSAMIVIAPIGGGEEARVGDRRLGPVRLRVWVPPHNVR